MPLIQGWLLDCYPSKTTPGMTIWIKEPDGKAIQLKDSKWHAKIYASGSVSQDSDYIMSKINSSNLIHSTRYTYKRSDLLRRKKNRVLEIELENASKTRILAELMERIFQNPDSLQLYNVDVMPEQQYFYEKDLFPLAFVDADVDEEGEIKGWNLLDNVSSYDYETPKLRTLRLAIEISDLVPRFDSKLLAIVLYSPDGDGEKEIARICGTEREILQGLMVEVTKFDPDLIITENGDSFVLPFLYSKSSTYGIDLARRLNRDMAVRSNVKDERIGGKTYFSYGRILYRPTTHRLFGRLHLDEENTFVYDQCMLEGLFEISRLCRIPIHTSMRASIGKCLSSLQFYYASTENILIPWKPEITEDFKNGYELFNADRGGLVLKPLPGVHEHVGEVDFASLYPSIIRKYNISAETVNCPCCDSSRYQIEELRMHVCDKQEGIVARSLALPLSKRFEYKRLRDQTTDNRLKKMYNERAGSLKWILVCCFGYLSYRNAKFGKIDSHIAVCALARKTLIEAMRTAEYNGFRVVHGIVDSLWLSKRNATFSNYEELKGKIETSTGFKLAIEGIYKWIVFLPSKTYSGKQVANRYFGVFEGSNEIKARGIEIRRRDSPLYFKKCQREILSELAKCDNVEELRKCARWKCVEIFEKNAKSLEDHRVPSTELIITRRLSRNPEDYSTPRHLSVNAASHLAREGLKLQAGQSISYVITHYKASGTNRSIPEELVSAEDMEYDSERYIEFLADCYSSVLFPLGVTKEELLTRSRSLLSY